jgi:hypothetical protein
MAKLKQLLKKFKNTLTSLWHKLLTKFGHKPIWQIEEGHVIEPAFISGGVQYYRLKDYFNTFSLRGLMALQVYEEFNMRMTKEVLTEYIEKVDKILSNPKQINVGELAMLNHRIKERVNMVMPTTDIIYKFASVAYFDKNESPYSYDPEYNAGKIKKWKEATDIDSFFIVMQLRDILPLPQLSKEDLAVCLQIVDSVGKMGWQKG